MKYEEIFTGKAMKELADNGVAVPAKDEFICNNCPEVDTCEFAWDLYNTDGDCVADK
jgi:hypothetical protein